ncbi:hypothetical protein BCR41DRAFT_176625 [Lobosporangium transversale]|uniref:Alpha/beta hydrolase fold-3 domain-containing protein n=1 Tax=Lobosporangium transversale TaxID=64571 RepID=A0A1Y2GAT8_9FUNG|nr:hypothetical protein BCR41DRAFT_176625 [Lobosporangium transversale]ORZ05727.1 hypothetical protein BCR41DRAFT_176625 [Lobosporangium transversale]|eukprot:XP_021877214.1 hypothetical protein BCR41DRAFT_176625 [Lobosporangium transversale]
MNYACNYICGDPETCPNPRNALGKARKWEWYSHLAQHPLVSPVHRADLSGLTNTLLQTATHDRQIDDSRLYAHRLGLENPDKLVRIEVYKNMVHVHHVFSVLEFAAVARRNIARFIDRSRHYRDFEEGNEESKGNRAQETETGGSNDNSNSINDSKNAQRAIALQKVERKYVSLGMVNHKSTVDGVEWVALDYPNKEVAKDEGWPMSVLTKSWPPNDTHEE